MDLTRAEWRKSSHSGGNGGTCVEVTTRHPGPVAVRDSKDPHGPVLTVTPDEWNRFLHSLRATT
jgi:hypothetical protein